MKTAAHDLLASYPVTIELSVQWGDMDAFSHVNNTVYFRYFESARIAYLQRMGVLDDVSGGQGIGPVLVQTSCNFQAALTYPDRVLVGARVVKLGESSFSMQYAIASDKLSAIAAAGDGVVVSIDLATGRKVRVPDRWREAIRALDGAEL